jgi:uncharacterized membrane protein YkvA (DUF1232 family)
MRIISRITDWVSTPYTIFLVLKDPDIPRSVKIRAVFVLVVLFAYLVSPMDIVPDFIPFAGWLDDMVVIPLGLFALRKFTPGIDVIEKRNRAQRSIRRVLIWAALALILFILLGLFWLGFLIYFIVRFING